MSEFRQVSQTVAPPDAPRVLIPTGFGLNCEAETAHACRLSGMAPDLVHINDVLAGHVSLSDYGMVVMIGGFAFGDHLGAGKVLSIRLAHRLPESLADFADAGGLLLGICNGFQTLTKMGLLPRLNGAVRQTLTVTTNDRGRFHDGWIRLAGERSSPCVFTRGLDRLELPVRHGEGKVVPESEELRRELETRGLVPVRYIDRDDQPTEEFPFNPNGSPGGMAGVCDPTGRVFGLMPHPEAYHSPYLHPRWPQQRRTGTLPEEGPGLLIFKNAADYLRERV